MEIRLTKQERNIKRGVLPSSPLPCEFSWQLQYPASSPLIFAGRHHQMAQNSDPRT
jgi:hypothetical protein